MSVLTRPAAMILSRLQDRISGNRARRRIESRIARGMTVGKNVSIHWSTVIDDNYPYLISIGDNCHLCEGVCLLAHDAAIVKSTDLNVRIGKIEIKENCIIGPNCIVLPGVTVGPNVIAVAGSFINRDVPPNSRIAGVPARIYGRFDEVIEYHRTQIGERPTFQYEELRYKPDKELREKVRAAVQNGDAYVLGSREIRSTLINGES